MNKCFCGYWYRLLINNGVYEYKKCERCGRWSLYFKR